MLLRFTAINRAWVEISPRHKVVKQAVQVLDLPQNAIRYRQITVLVITLIIHLLVWFLVQLSYLSQQVASTVPTLAGFPSTLRSFALSVILCCLDERGKRNLPVSFILTTELV